MEKELKYMILTVESYPFGFEVKYFYLPVMNHIQIGDVIKSKHGHRYKIIDGKTKLSMTDIDTKIYIPFE